MKTIIKNLIYHAKLISSSRIIFYFELKNIKQTLIDNYFPSHIVDKKKKHTIKNSNSNCNWNNPTLNN